MKKIQTGLRVPETVNQETVKAAEGLGISKNDYILLAIQEKLKKEALEQKLLISGGEKNDKASLS